MALSSSRSNALPLGSVSQCGLVPAEVLRVQGLGGSSHNDHLFWHLRGRCLSHTLTECPGSGMSGAPVRARGFIAAGEWGPWGIDLVSGRLCLQE